MTHSWFPPGDRSLATLESQRQASPPNDSPSAGPYGANGQQMMCGAVGEEEEGGDGAMHPPNVQLFETAPDWSVCVPWRGKGYRPRGKGAPEVLGCPSGLLPACLAPPLFFQKLGAWKLEGILSSPRSLACLNPLVGKKAGGGS